MFVVESRVSGVDAPMRPSFLIIIRNLIAIAALVCVALLIVAATSAVTIIIVRGAL